MILSYSDLISLIDRGVIRGVTAEHVNGSSIDLTVSDVFLREERNPLTPEDEWPVVNLNRRDPLYTEQVELVEGVMLLEPGQFVLAVTQQEFNLPLDLSAEYKLKSSLARVGLNHALAGWCDPGWRGALTLELQNTTQHHVIALRKGDRIGQMVFMPHKLVPASRSYRARGAYQDVFEATGPLPTASTLGAGL